MILKLEIEQIRSLSKSKITKSLMDEMEITHELNSSNSLEFIESHYLSLERDFVRLNSF